MQKTSSKKKWVLITGISSGIGEAIANELAEDPSFFVLGTVRDAKSLRRWSSRGLHVFQVDLAIEAERERFLLELSKVMEEGSEGILSFHLVNNAGVVRAGPLEHLPLSDWKYEFEVNFFAVVHLTQKSIPFVRKHSGSIINMSSISGRVSFPLLGAYSASKFALEAMTDSLRRELPDNQIKVVLIEPGSIRTPIWKKSSEWSKASLLSDGADNRYAGLMKFLFQYSTEGEAKGLDPRELGQLVKKVIGLKNPKPRYLIGRGTLWKDLLSRWFPTRLIDSAIMRSLKRDDSLRSEPQNK